MVQAPREHTDVDSRQQRWALAGLAAAMVLAMSTWFSTAAVLPQLREQWNLGSSGGSWLTISVQLGFVVGAVVSALTNVADLVAPRRLMLLGAIGAAGANAALLASDGLGSALPLRAATGASLALVYPAAMKAMATWFVARRGMALGVMVGSLTVGSALPHAVNGLGGIEWESVILATSVLTLFGGLLAVLGSDGPHVFPRAVFDPRLIGAVVRNRNIRLATMGYFGHMWELYAMWSWFAVFFADATGAGRSATAWAAFGVIGIGFVGAYVGGRLSDRYGRAESTMVAMAISGAMAAIIGFGTGFPSWLVLVLGLVWGFWVVADSAQFSTIVIENADPRHVGTAVTLQLAAGFVLTVATIWLVPVLRDGPGWGVAFLVLAGGPFFGLIAMRGLVGSRVHSRAS